SIWFERGCAVLTLGLLKLIKYEQTVTVTKLARHKLSESAPSRFHEQAPESLLPSRRAPHAAPLPPETRAAAALRFASTEPAPNPAPRTSRLMMVPDQEDGHAMDVRLIGIRPKSLLGLLGLQNGDHLEAINGYPIATP